MDINEMAKEVHALAKEKGWHDSRRSPLEMHMLIVSEVAEATEAVRKSKPPIYVIDEETGNQVEPDGLDSFGNQFEDIAGVLKTEGEAVELGDAVIRIMDYFELNGWDLAEVIALKHEYNKTRSYRHGGKAL